VLVVVHLGVEAEGTKGAIALRQEERHSSIDEDLHQVVVERPPGLVVARDRRPYEADLVVDHRCCDGGRPARRLVRDQQCYLGPGKHR
jgi:hypothetical protein